MNQKDNIQDRHIWERKEFYYQVKDMVDSIEER